MAREFPRVSASQTLVGLVASSPQLAQRHKEPEKAKAANVHPPAIQAPVRPTTVSKMTTATPARATPSSSNPAIA